MCMGLRRQDTEVRGENGEWLSQEQRWRGVGNAIHLGLMKHFIVSLLVCKGYITRDDCRLRGQIWTVNQDGPSRAEWAKLCGRLEAAGTAKVSGWSPAQEQREATRVKGERQGGVSATSVGQQLPKRVTMQEVYDQLDAKGRVTTRRIPLEMGMLPPTRDAGESQQEFRRQLKVDMMAMSKAPLTWKAYARWWPLWEQCTQEYGVEPWRGGEHLDSLMAVMQDVVVDLYAKGGFAAKTIGQMVQAVVTRLKDTGQGDLRSFPEMGAQTEGLARILGTVVQKKDCTSEEEVAAFLDEQIPDWAGQCGELQWLNLVNIVVLAWAVFLRKQEIINLKLCDLQWEQDKLRVWVQNTKNDKQGEGRESCVHAAETSADGRGLMEEIRNGLMAVHGTLERSEKCTKAATPTRRCEHCRPVFPSVTANKKHRRPIPESSLPKLIKKGYRWLEERGVVPEGKYRKISTSSLRRGGNTMAAAEGIRQTVRAKHGRWRSEATPTEYDGLAPGEESRVTSALNSRLARARGKRAVESCSTGCGEL